MLIALDNFLAAEIEEFSDPEWSALNNLAIAAREGSHFLIAPRPLAKLLSFHEKIGPRERSIFKMIYERYSTIASVCERVTVSILLNYACAPGRRVNRGRTEILLPLSFFRNTKSIQPVILLAENRDDCEAIQEIARVFAHVNRFGAIQTTLQWLPGGGSQTFEVANDLLKEGKQLAVAIVDSDRVTPQGAIGDTAKNTGHVFKKWNRAFSEFLVIGARDLENLLPDEFFREYLAGDPNHCNSVSFMTQLVGCGCKQARLYIDIEKGLNLDALLHPQKRSNDFGEIWDSVIAAVGDRRLPVLESCEQCVANKGCANPGKCHCHLTTPNSIDLLPQGSVHMRRNGRELWRSMPDFMKGAFDEVGRMVFDWGCAPRVQAG